MLTVEEKRTVLEARRNLTESLATIDAILKAHGEWDEDDIEESEKKSKVITEKMVMEYLLKLGMPSSLLGFKYATEGIILWLNAPHGTIAMTKELYPEVARKYHTTPSRVERAIRHAIEKLIEGTTFTNNKDFDNFIKGQDVGRGITNTEFISLVALNLQLMK